MDTNKYYGEIKATREQIPDAFVFLMSLEDTGRGWKGGSVTEVTRENAAKCIVDKSHRLATPAEVKAFHEQQERQRKDLRMKEANKFASILADRLNGESEAPAAKNKDAAK